MYIQNWCEKVWQLDLIRANCEMKQALSMTLNMTNLLFQSLMGTSKVLSFQSKEPQKKLQAAKLQWQYVAAQRNIIRDFVKDSTELNE